MSPHDNDTDGRTRMWRFRRVVHRYINPITRPFAKKLLTFAILTHRGRKTGRTYRTPINVFRQGNDYFVFLTYGSDVQWVKNVLAIGSCSIETRGRVVGLVDPELITDPDLRPAPPPVRFVERRIAGVTQYLRMRAARAEGIVVVVDHEQALAVERQDVLDRHVGERERVAEPDVPGASGSERPAGQRCPSGRRPAS